MYNFRKTSSISYFVIALVLAICCTFVFACANQDKGKQVNEHSDDPSKTEEPTVNPGSSDTKPLDNPTEPENEAHKEESDNPSSGGTKTTITTGKNKNNKAKDPSKSTTNSQKSSSDLPLVKDSNKKPSENDGVDNPTIDESKQLLEGAVDFIQGNMVHAIPDSMPYQKVSKVSLVIGKRDNLESIKEKALELSGVKDTNLINTAKNITIGRKMKAVLSDPMAKVSPAFEITSTTSEEQFVDLYNNESIDWLWNVIPLKPGAHELSMTLEVTLKNDLGESTRSIPVYNDKVKIFVPEKAGIPTSYEAVAMPKDTTETMVQKNNLIAENIEPSNEPQKSYMGLIISGGVLSVGIVLFFFLRKQNHHSKNTVFAQFSQEDVKELDRLQSKGDIQQVLRYVLNKIPDNDPQRNDVELLWQNYKDNEKDNAQNLIAYEQYTQARSKISLAVITLIDEIREMSAVTENNQPA